LNEEPTHHCIQRRCERAEVTATHSACFDIKVAIPVAIPLVKGALNRGMLFKDGGLQEIGIASNSRPCSMMPAIKRA